MRIHEIALVTSLGPGAGEKGEFILGRTYDRVFEYNAIEKYMTSLRDELEQLGVRFQVYEKGNVALRAKQIADHSLIVHCGIGWFDNKSKRTVNISRVYYSDSNSGPIAREITDVCSEWGPLHVFGHKTANPQLDRSDPFLALDHSLAVRIEPYAINGPDAGEYYRYLDRFGKDIARYLGSKLEYQMPARAAKTYFG